MTLAPDRPINDPARLWRRPRPALLALLTTTLAAIAPATHAQSPTLFAEAALSRATLDIAGETFNPALVRVQGGWYFATGIALAVQIGAGVSDDSSLGFDASIDSLASWFLRFESPETHGFRVSLQGGYSETRLSLENRNGASPGEETFTSPSLGVGIAQRLGQSPWSLSADYYRHYQKDDFDVRTLSIGLQYDF